SRACDSASAFGPQLHGPRRDVRRLAGTATLDPAWIPVLRPPVTGESSLFCRLDPPVRGDSMIRRMPLRVTIGDFSRMTHLSVKALRHYHEIGLLEPVAVSPESGYRLYDVDQVPTAQVIRRLKDLGMPLD